jgi:hypothetical protein
MADVAINFAAPPTLSAFLEDDGFVRIVNGPIGSGKSSACVLEILRRAVEQEPGPDGVRRTRFAVIRNTYGQLRDTTRKTFEQWIPAELGEEGDGWAEQAFTFTMCFKDGSVMSIGRRMQLEAMGLPVPDGDVECEVHCEVLFRALDGADDVKKVLSLELTGAYFNEVREISKEIFDGMQGRVGRYPSKMQGGPTWDGVWADTNSWHAGHWLQELAQNPPKGWSFYFQPDGLGPEAENIENLREGYYQRLCAGKDEEWIDVYVRAKIAKSDTGSIFGKQLTGLAARGGICDFPHGENGVTQEVFTAWDLGHSDATFIWFFIINANGLPDIIDGYGNSGEHISFYFDILRHKPYKYAKHCFPHDSKHKTVGTKMSVLEQAQAELGPGNVVLCPSMSVTDGIGAARWVLEQPGTRIHTRCNEPIRNESGGEEHKGGLKALWEYRFVWDEDTKVFSRKPLHNWASNPADSFRYLSIMIRFIESMTRKPAPQAAVDLSRTANQFRLNDLFEAAAKQPKGTERI